MPAPIDLTGERFGILNVLRLLDERDKHNRRVWLCRCDCGSEAPVCAMLLQSGKTTRCGRRCPCRKVKHHAGTFTKGKARALHKERAAIIDEAGLEWLAPRAAAAYLGVSKTTLDNYGNFCPYLDGASLESRLFPTAYNRKISYWLKSDPLDKERGTLDKVLTNRAKRKLAPAIDSLTYFGDAVASLRTSVGTLRRRMMKDQEKVIKLPVKREIVCAGKRCYRSFLRVYVRSEYLGSLLEKPADKLTRQEAADVLGITLGALDARIRRGVLRTIQGGSRKNGVMLARSSIEAPRNATLPGINEAARTPLPRDDAPPKPHWDEATATLYWGTQPIREFRNAAKNQRDIVEAFHRAGWERTIPDPLRDQRKLNLTIYELNKTLAPKLIRFRGDGTGEGIMWEAVE